MGTKPVYRVRPDGDTWQVSRNGATLNTFDEKDTAVTEARRMAEVEEPSELVIHTRHDLIDEEDTFVDDPAPVRTVSRC